MDVQLQELIDKIKKDGVAAAEKKAADIISTAEANAEKIISDAKAQAEEIKKEAKLETERMEKASEEAIVQAGRNMLLTFKDSLINELDSLVQKETETAFSKDLMEKLVPETVKAWVKNTDASELSVLLSEKDLKTLESAFTSKLQAEIAQGLEIKADKSLSTGFRIGVKNGAAFYDYSAETLAEMFAAYLNPKVAALLKESAKGQN
jgi:V/A-type H+-transporting ATPase subunit E